MYPFLKNGQVVLMKKYNLNLKQNDIVVIKKNNKIIVKRLVGLPNDLVKLDNYVFVNGNKFDDEVIDTYGDMPKEVKLRNNEYYVLGDNRNHSIDSRFSEIGLINRKEIIGKIVLINGGN